MSGSQLGRRLGITAQTVQDLEKSEATGKTQLNSLRKAADAMDCVLVYALVPGDGLEAMVERRACSLAFEALRRVSRSMALEDQQVADHEFDTRIQRYIETSLRDRDLWDER